MAQIHDNINEEKYKDKIKTEKCFLYQFLKIIYSTLLKILSARVSVDKISIAFSNYSAEFKSFLL